MIVVLPRSRQTKLLIRLEHTFNTRIPLILFKQNESLVKVAHLGIVVEEAVSLTVIIVITVFLITVLILIRKQNILLGVKIE